MEGLGTEGDGSPRREHEFPTVREHRCLCLCAFGAWSHFVAVGEDDLAAE